MDILYPKDKRLELFQGIRPVTAPDSQQRNESTSNTSRKRQGIPDRPKTAQKLHEWNVRKPRNLMPIKLDREVCKARRVLHFAECDNFSKVNKIGSPGGHIARLEAKKKGEKLKIKFGTKTFCFSENLDDLMSYHTTDSLQERPEWSEQFVKHHIEIAEREIGKRKEKRAKEKAQSTCDNAISVTMHDIVAMYTSPCEMPQGKYHYSSHPTPVHLNDDEVHVWQKLRMSLYSCGQFFSHKYVDHLAAKHKHGSEPMHPIFAHFLRYLNILLGGSSSLQAARRILLKDVSYLLKLLQEIDVLKLPLDSLREATAFRMRALTMYGKRLRRRSFSDDCSTLSGSHSDVMAGASCEPRSDERRWAADEMNLFDRLSSWMFSLSLLAKIALVSAERTPLKKLLKQKNRNSNGAVTVVSRKVCGNVRSSAHSLFRRPVVAKDDDTSVCDEAVTEVSVQEKRRQRTGSLSMILGVCPGLVAPAEKYSSKVLSVEDEKSELTEAEIIALRHEFFGSHTTATDFHSIKRSSTSSYGDLEKLLMPFYHDTDIITDAYYPMLDIYDEDGGRQPHVPAMASSGDTPHGDRGAATSSENVKKEHVLTDDNSTGLADTELLSYLEMNGAGRGERKFRVDSKGVMFMSDGNGKFKKCSKDLSLYYDMLTEEETMSSMLHAYHNDGDRHDITALDLFRSNMHHNDETLRSVLPPGGKLEEVREKEKQRKLKENSQFVDVLVRATELHMHEAPRSKIGHSLLRESLR